MMQHQKIIAILIVARGEGSVTRMVVPLTNLNNLEVIVPTQTHNFCSKVGYE